MNVGCGTCNGLFLCGLCVSRRHGLCETCGGHNGIRNIIERLGSQSFIRLKVGVGKDKSNVIGHVLGKFDPASRTTVDKVVSASVQAVASILRDGADKAMNVFNGWTPDAS